MHFSNLGGLEFSYFVYLWPQQASPIIVRNSLFCPCINTLCISDAGISSSMPCCHVWPSCIAWILASWTYSPTTFWSLVCICCIRISPATCLCNVKNLFLGAAVPVIPSQKHQDPHFSKLHFANVCVFIQPPDMSTSPSSLSSGTCTSPEECSTIVLSSSSRLCSPFLSFPLSGGTRHNTMTEKKKHKNEIFSQAKDIIFVPSIGSGSR